MSNPVEVMEVATWSPEGAPHVSDQAIVLLECGKVLLMPKLAFKLTKNERDLLSPASADGKAKNINYDPRTGNLRGSLLSGDRRKQLAGMIERFNRQARHLVETLLPSYKAQLDTGMTSYRPLEIEGRLTSVTKDDTRLHVDAFASRPNRGLRILRVFSNINPDGRPRVWELGEPFETVVERFHSRVRPQWPGSASLLQALHITKGRRSEYDHIMLSMHDEMKRDTGYQAGAPRERIEFPAGSTWICFSDRVSHAALSGQYLLEQTFYLPVGAMQDESYSPLRILERRFQRRLA